MPTSTTTWTTMTDPTYRRAFGQRIKALRKERGWTQKDLAARLSGMRYQLLNKYEGGHSFPSPEVIIGIAQQLGVSLDYLLTGEQPVDQPLTNTRLLDRFRVLQDFLPNDQETVITVIDAMVARQRAQEAAMPFRDSAAASTPRSPASSTRTEIRTKPPSPARKPARRR